MVFVILFPNIYQHNLIKGCSVDGFPLENQLTERF